MVKKEEKGISGRETNLSQDKDTVPPGNSGKFPVAVEQKSSGKRIENGKGAGVISGLDCQELLYQT